MRRRFTLAIAGVVAAALTVAGLGTLLLLTVESRRSSRSDVTHLATRIATEASAVPVDEPSVRRLQNFLRQTEELTIVVVDRAGSTASPLPAGISRSDLRPPALASGLTVSGFDGGRTFAAVPFTKQGIRFAAVVSRATPGGGAAGLYFLLAGALALAVAVATAEALARRITQPIVALQRAGARIAEGDFLTRVELPARAYPEIVDLAAALNAMAGSLERLRGQERQFLLSVSHDLRTPLTSIRGFAEALADGTATDTPKAAGVIAAEANRLERLVRDLLDLAKLDARQFTLEMQPTDLFEVVSDTAHGFEPTAEALGLRVVVHDPVTPGPFPPVLADPDRLAQVIANLVENACKYAHGSIDVGTWYRLGTGGPEALVTVDDDGPGIPAEDLPHVFDRLWTDTRGRARQVGSGLGLAIVSELVGAMGGRIRAESPIPVWDRATAGSRGGTRLIVSLRPAE